VARNIARSRSLREPGFLAIVAPYRFSKPPGSNQWPHYACNTSLVIWPPCARMQGDAN